MTVSAAKPLTGDQYIKVCDMIEHRKEPLIEDIKDLEDDVMDIKLCLTKITAVAGFLKWGIPIGITAGISLGAIIATILT